MEISKPDRNIHRKLARELWDYFIEIYTDSVPQKRSNQDPSMPASSFDNKDSQLASINRENVRKFIVQIKNKMVLDIIISLISTLFNIGDTMANNEIFSEYRYLWPSSLANSNSLNLNCLTDILYELMNSSISNITIFNPSWLRTYSDICYAKLNNSDCVKCFLQLLAWDSKYFYRIKQVKSSNQNISKKEDSSEERIVDEKFIKQIIKSCVFLNKHTQAALLCQLLPNNNDYSNAFKFLQEGSIVCPIPRSNGRILYVHLGYGFIRIHGKS